MPVKYTIVLFILIYLTQISYCQDTAKIDTSQYITGDNDYNLLLASYLGYDSEVFRLLDLGADADIQTSEGITPLMYAVQNGNINTVKTLVYNDASINERPENGVTALIHSVQYNNSQIAEFLIREGAEINLSDYDSVSPLMYAVLGDLYTMTDMLLYYGADVEKKDIDGTNALMSACYIGDTSIVFLLLNAGASINTKDNEGRTPLHIAIQRGNIEAVELLIAWKADVNNKTNNGYSPLSTAICYEDIQMIDLLLKNNVEINHTISGKYNNMDIARETKNDSIIDLLRSNGAKSKVKPILYKTNFTLAARYNLDDHSWLLNYSKIEKRSNIEIFGEYSFRLWANRILYEVDDDLSYQLYEKRACFSAGLIKNFRLSSPYGNNLIEAMIGIKESYTFGSFRGSEMKPDAMFVFIPMIGLSYGNQYAGLKLGYEYVDFKIPGFSKNMINIGFYLSFYKKGSSYQPKQISWLNYQYQYF